MLPLFEEAFFFKFSLFLWILPIDKREEIEGTFPQFGLFHSPAFDQSYQHYPQSYPQKARPHRGFRRISPLFEGSFPQYNEKTREFSTTCGKPMWKTQAAEKKRFFADVRSLCRFLFFSKKALDKNPRQQPSSEADALSDASAKRPSK